MSFVGQALRMAAVRAIATAGTIAENRVFDSAILPIADEGSERARPFVVVSTEAQTITASGRDIWTGNGEIELLIDIVMANVVSLPAKDGDDLVQFAVRETDAALELGLSVLSRQILAALLGRGGGAWGAIFRQFAPAFKTVQSARATMVKDGYRLAGRQILITISAVAEPPIGPLGADSIWRDLIDAIEADPVTADLAGVYRAAMEAVPIDWPETYTAAAVAAGYTEEQAQRIGIAIPMPADADGFAAVLNEVELFPDGLVGDADVVAEQIPGED